MACHLNNRIRILDYLRGWYVGRRLNKGICCHNALITLPTIVTLFTRFTMPRRSVRYACAA